MILLYIVFPNINEARKIGRLLVKMRLVACVNILPIESMFNWQGKFSKTKETVLIAKTLKGKLKKIEILVENFHSYEVPFIGWWSVTVNQSYLNWLKSELK